MRTDTTIRKTAIHPICGVVRLRAARKTLWMRKLWSALPETGHPAAIPDQEVDLILSEDHDSPEAETQFYRTDQYACDLSAQIERAERNLCQFEPWSRLATAFELTSAEQGLLLLALAVVIDPSLGRVYAYLLDQVEMTQATPRLANALFGGELLPSLSATSNLVAWRILRPAPEVFAVPDAWRAWTVDPAVLAWIGAGLPERLPIGIELIKAKDIKPLSVLYGQELEEITRFAGLRAQNRGIRIELELVGPAGCGRRILAAQFAALHDMPLLAVDAESLLHGLPETETLGRVVEAVRVAVHQGALLYWRDSGDAASTYREVLRRVEVAVIGRTASLPNEDSQAVARRTLELNPLSRQERERLWSSLTTTKAPEQLRDWALTPGEIAKVADVASAGQEAIHQACRRPSDSLSVMVRMPLPFETEDMVLAPHLRQELEDFESQIRLRWDVYEDWGFGRLCPNGRGIVGLFGGPSGTGKTMAAQVLARKLGLELYRLDPAQVVNKYIGETEKRLKSIFDECDRAHFLLLIDECEGLFGQRFNSKDAHDRYANLEIDYLLQRLERFQGVAILATNRKNDIDSAFLRRIRFVIDFMPPGAADRIKIWQSAIPECSPSKVQLRGDIDWQLLGEKAVLTGAEIKLAALNAAFLAFGQKQPIGMVHLKTAISRELAKKGETLRGFSQ